MALRAVTRRRTAVTLQGSHCHMGALHSGGLAVARLGQLCWHAACLQPGLHWCAAGAAPRPLPRTGVVLRVNAAARTAVVAWLGQAADGSLQPLEPAEAGETVSVYSIVVSCPALCILGAVFADSSLHPRQSRLEFAVAKARRCARWCRSGAAYC